MVVSMDNNRRILAWIATIWVLALDCASMDSNMDSNSIDMSMDSNSTDISRDSDSIDISIVTNNGHNNISSSWVIMSLSVYSGANCNLSCIFEFPHSLSDCLSVSAQAWRMKHDSQIIWLTV